MRKLKGITINGEWLGDSVVINGLFRAICSISPIVMQEFIKVINSIEKLDEAVRINKFSFPDNNTIEIGFSNDSLKGLADLYFCLDNGSPKLLDSKLRILTPQEIDLEQDFEEKTLDLDEDEIECGNEILESAKLQLNQEKEAQNIEEVLSNEAVEGLQETDELVSSEDCIEEDDVFVSEDTSANEANPAFEMESVVESEVDAEEKTPLITDENIITKEAISSMVDEIISRAPDIAARPIQIQLVQPVQSQAPQIQPIIIQTDSTTNKIEESANSAIDEAYSEEEPDIAVNSFDKTEDIAVEEELTEAEEDTEVDAYADNEMTFDTVEDTNTAELLADEEEIKSEVEELADNDNIVVEEQETSDPQDNNLLPDTPDNDESIQEDIEECLSEFYNTEKDVEESVINEQTKDNIAMQAMLAEMMLLRDELNKLKAEPSESAETTKPTVNEFFGNNEEFYNIEDEDADFKIMANGTRINASILDEDLFIAGNKLYRWGDTLYLDE